MLKFPQKNTQQFALSMLFALVTVFSLFLWQGNKGFSLWDEGFLWYGAQRVMLGEIPIRDFMAYDPGRYYWSAAIMTVLDDNGIIALRVALTIFEIPALATGLFLIARSQKNPNFIFLLFSCLILATWMYPRHKLFDISISIFLIGILAALIEQPTKRQFFFTGLCTGVIAIFGRNHGVYGVAATLCVMLWLNIRKAEGIHFYKNGLCWAAGIAVGFSPVILMAVLIPGFGKAFEETIRFLFEIKSTNLPLPIPWPWLVEFSAQDVGESIRGLCVGLFFIGAPAFGCIALLWVFWQKFKCQQVPAAVCAAAFLALPYTQFAYSRADVSHLAQGIFPFLIGILVLISGQTTKIKWPATFVLLLSSLWILVPIQPGWQCRQNRQCVAVEIAGKQLEVDPATANDIGQLRLLAKEYAPDNQSFVAAPFWPGAYALLGRKAPMWEIFALFPRSAEFEQMEIARIRHADPGFAIILDISLDGRDELRFKNTHPLINQYIQDHFTLLPTRSTSNYLVLKKKDKNP